MNHHRTLRRACGARLAGRSQSGFTMVEVILVVGLMSMVLLPLFGFVVLGFSQTDATTTRNATASDLGLAQTSFARDAAVSTLMTNLDPGTYGQCTLPTGHTIHTRMVEEKIESGELTTAVVLYTSGPEVRRDGTEVAGRTSLHRLECRRISASGRENTHQVGDAEQQQLVRNIGSSAAVHLDVLKCPVSFPLRPQNENPAQQVRQRNCVELTLRFTPQTVPPMQAELRGRQVAGSDSDPDIAGVPAPRVSMVVSPDDPPRLPTTNEADPYRLGFTATVTPPPSWTVTGWEYSVLRQSDDAVAPGFTAPACTTALTCTLSHDFDPDAHQGRYTVRVTVTVAGTVDGETVSQSASSYRVVDPANQAPVVRLNSDMGDRTVVRCRSITFSMRYGNSSGANEVFDPDTNDSSTLVRPPSWSFPNAGSANTPEPGPRENWQVVYDQLGVQEASLTVQDDLGAATTYSQRIYVERGSVNFSMYDNANDGLDGGSAHSDGFTRRAGTGASRVREVYFRPKDWRCGGTLVSLTMFKCASAPYPPANVAEGQPPCQREGYSEGTAYRCLQNLPPDPRLPEHWIYDLDQNPCTATPDWVTVDGVGGNLIDWDNVTDADEMPNNWRFRAVWPEPANVSGYFYVVACSDLNRDPTDTDPDALPAQRCTASKTFTRTS